MACLAVLGFFLLAAAPASGRDSWYIACGRNSTVRADNGLIFEGDGTYIRTGVSRKVSAAIRNNMSAELSTLREFPLQPWKKSCYSVPVEQGTKVLVRVQFYYGNYDMQDSPPGFSIRFDTSEYCTVSTYSDSTTWAFCEVVYVTTKKQGTDICLVRTETDQSPIISTIEIRRLQRSMYQFLDYTKYALFRRRRFAFGASETIGYPNDTYNRNWEPNDLLGIEGGADKPVIVKTDGSKPVNSTDDIDNIPPPLLFQTAAVAPMVGNRTATNLTIRTPWLPSDATNIYLAMYFTEPISDIGVSNPRKRAFNVYMDGEVLSENEISPSYGLVSWFYAYMYKASNETTFNLVPAKGSILPPAISAMEIFLINDIDNATHSKDVQALSMLQSSFTVLNNWTGDPCLPEDYNWEWVVCDYPDESPPRINKLKLSGYQLSGTLPDFSDLDALVEIDVSNNSLTGRVPEFLASFPDLQSLDLSDNDFDSIPQSLANNSMITVSTKGNPKLHLQSTSNVGQAPGPSPSTSGCSRAINNSTFISFLICLAIAVSI